MFCVTVTACALVGILGTRIENSVARMAHENPNVATSVKPEVAMAMNKACRSVKVLIRHRIPHSTTEQYFATAGTPIAGAFSNLADGSTPSLSTAIPLRLTTKAAMATI